MNLTLDVAAIDLSATITRAVDGIPSLAAEPVTLGDAIVNRIVEDAADARTLRAELEQALEQLRLRTAIVYRLAGVLQCIKDRQTEDMPPGDRLTDDLMAEFASRALIDDETAEAGIEAVCRMFSPETGREHGYSEYSLPGPASDLDKLTGYLVRTRQGA